MDQIKTPCIYYLQLFSDIKWSQTLHSQPENDYEVFYSSSALLEIIKPYASSN